MQRPPDDDTPEYFRLYTNQAPDGDILVTLAAQIDETLGLLRGLDEERGEFRYGEGKWSIKEVVGHLVDTERIFGCRALCFARGDAAALPGFEQDDYVANGDFAKRPLSEVVEEFRIVRASHLALFGGFSEAAWGRHGVANGVKFRTRSIPWILAGHELHHRKVLQERYEL
jgi:hypothetical protein